MMVEVEEETGNVECDNRLSFDIDLPAEHSVRKYIFAYYKLFMI